MNNLLCINSPFNQAFLNLAAEEYLLKNFRNNIFLLYVNKPSVIIGKHQNAYAEADTLYIEQENIPLVRRLSGGGTVYHDLGNLNFSWIVQGEKNKPVNFNKYMNDVFLFLKSLNIDVEKTKNNDMTIGGKKISGNAEHIFKNRLIHHGTLLFNTNLKILNKVLTTQKINYTDKAVCSKKAEVSNILPLMKDKISITEFSEKLFRFVMKKHTQSIEYRFSDEDIEKINRLAEKKYRTWAWNFAYSPEYNFQKSLKINQKEIFVCFSVKEGIITAFNMKTDALNEKEKHIFTKKMIGVKHCSDEIMKIIKQYISLPENENLIHLFF